MKLKGKVAVISGAAGAMGATEARLFAAEGASVVLGDVNATEGESVARDIEESGGQAMFRKLDVTQESDWVEIVTAAEERFGPVSILINNAGVFRTTLIHETTVEDWTTSWPSTPEGSSSAPSAWCRPCDVGEPAPS